jgi:hypothetical protein
MSAHETLVAKVGRHTIEIRADDHVRRGLTCTVDGESIPLTGHVPPRYRHTQQGPSYRVIAALGALLTALAGGGLAWELPWPLVVALAGAGVFVMLVGSCFHRLTVADESDRLAVQFGFLPLFGKRIHYAEIQAVEIGRTTLLDGWGIHLNLQGRWVWNLWARDCVVIHHGGITRIGTDDADNLAAFLKRQLTLTHHRPA